jgi:YXWGXW repeat-containing protein
MHLRSLVLGLTLAAGATAMPASAATPSVIINRTPPPAEQPFEATPQPRKGFTWSPGFWEWRGTGYRWQPGEWITTKSGHRWQPYGWEEREGRFFFVHGGWQPLAQTASATQAGSR